MKPHRPTAWRTVDDVCEALGINRSTAYAWMALPADDVRHLPSQHIGRNRRVRDDDLAALQARLRAQHITEEAELATTMGVDELAAHFRISKRSANRLLADGVIPSQWVGRQRRARRVDVEAYAS